MEQIAMDMGNLLASQFPAIAELSNELRNAGLVSRMRAGGRVLEEELGLEDALRQCIGSNSDTVRGWGAMAVGQASDVPLEERLRLMAPFADDEHFAVREWAWLSMRPHIAAQARDAIRLLEAWTGDSSERKRRFSTEVTRPRGVWSRHLAAVKENPDLGLPLLEPLRADPSRYVQDSVANWLNDASKSCPVWVQALCERWMRATQDPNTKRVCWRATRSLRRLQAEAADI
jgi:3-methyladenine DNA glycosylase AlkC